MNNIVIVPVVKQLTNLQIVGINVTLNYNAVVSAVLTNEEGLNITYNLLMDQPTYEQWGSDDTFVENWVLNQLGLQRA